MKQLKIYVGVITLVLLLNINTIAQDISTFRFTVFKPLPQLDFATFAIANDLTGAPTVFSVEILSPRDDVMVMLEGVFEWQDVGESSPTQLSTFRTKPFKPKVFFNNTLGSEIRIASSSTNNNRITKAILKGKPTGKYIITLKLLKPLDEQGNSYIDYPGTSAQTEILEFLNPSQTLDLLLPIAGSLQDVGTVIAQWTPIDGATKYLIKAAVRNDYRQSLENAISSGQVLINNAEVNGNQTEVNLRTLLTGAEWFGGQEIVIQVTAFVSGPSGGLNIYSNLINFYIKDVNTSAYTSLIGNLLAIAQSLPSGVLPLNFLNGLSSGDILINGIKLDDGTTLSLSEVMAILNYLVQNPDERIVSASFNR